MYDTEFAAKEFEESGEAQLMKVLGGKLDVIFDVGSNIGEWTRLARSHNPDAKIHMFEIIPETYQQMIGNLWLDDKITPNGFGLASHSGFLPMKYVHQFPAMSTHIQTLNNGDFYWRQGMVIRGDDYVESKGIEYIDFLKLDTEGAEKLVLEGFKKTLEERKIGILQFEYGFANILVRWLLVDFYELLTPLGYKIGKLTPEGASFKNYELTDETFQGPNFIAVHESKLEYFS